MTLPPQLRIFTFTLLINTALSLTLSSKLVHRFSHESKSSIKASKWPQFNSIEYYKVLYQSDLQRQQHYELLLPVEGSQVTNLGNDFAWLFYAWIHIGTPSVPFLVALDTGSNLLWVPCECEQCAPLSGSQYRNMDRDLNEYHPSKSITCKHLPCSHKLCESHSSCHDSEGPCAYSVKYLSDNTSTSGTLVEDILHLATGREDASNTSVKAPVIVGCGMKQTGGYLDGAAPDGVMGLGLDEKSVPSYLAKTGLLHNTFSLCFDKGFSGRIYFGDQGPATQQSTPFSPLDVKYNAYIVGVERCCIGNSCLKLSSFRVLMDSGSSFTFLPTKVYNEITEEFDQQVNATRDTSNDNFFRYCYTTSSNELPQFPSLSFVFSPNNSFVVQQPVMTFTVNEGLAGFCLALQPTDSDIGIIGQNYMRGYRMVFDRENLKLSWSEFECEALSDGFKMPLAPKSAPPNPLPTTEQERAPSERAVAPAIAGRAPP